MGSKLNWLDRRIAAPGPYLALALDERDFRAACAHIKAEMPDAFLKTGQSHATTWFFDHPDGNGLVAIICMRDWRGRDSIEVAGLLVHEAVHVWQRYADWIGESRPGVEQEAYAVQAVAQELMAEFARRMGVAP